MSNVINKSANADLKGAIALLSDEELSKVSGGRVKTSDKMQKAVLDFIKG